MAQIEAVRAAALSLPEVTEAPHHARTSFRVRNKIFATWGAADNRLCLLLSPIQQSVFCLIPGGAIYPVPNAWGKQGATFVELDRLEDETVLHGLRTAYREKAPPALAAQVPESGR